MLLLPLYCNSKPVFICNICNKDSDIHPRHHFWRHSHLYFYHLIFPIAFLMVLLPLLLPSNFPDGISDGTPTSAFTVFLSDMIILMVIFPDNYHPYSPLPFLMVILPCLLPSCCQKLILDGISSHGVYASLRAHTCCLRKHIRPLTRASRATSPSVFFSAV